MDEVNAAEQTTPIKKRSFWLSLIIILTLTGNSLGLITAIGSVTGGQFSSILLKIPVLDANLIDDLSGNGLYIFIKIILYASSLTGAIFMWMLKRKGFWFYLSSQVLLLLIPFIFHPKAGIAYQIDRLIVNVIFVLFFVILYSLQLKKMD